MGRGYCLGCGADIQSTEPGQFGFVPEHLKDAESVLCQRCFRITHYGQVEIGPLSADASLESIRAGVMWSTGVCLVVDLLDFESGLPRELLALVRGKKLILVPNKVDLIPDKTPLKEVSAWVSKRLGHHGLPKVQTALVSAVTGHGFSELADLLGELGQKIVFVGITNVGKSSVLRRLLQMRLSGGQRGKVKPTISPYPGTTVDVSRWHCPGGLILADSPGYVPQGRISDLVSPKWAVKIIPTKTLTSHLYPLNAGEMVFVQGLCAVECISNKGHGLVLGFTGSGVRWQKSSSKHLNKWLGKESDQALISSWEEHLVQLEPGKDLTISGLGWVSARKARYELRLHMPKGVQFAVRPNLIGPKQQKNR
ncbi:MAG TPA: hypothetical protein DDW87_08285 [Firmicutes bacterium]|nr:hypothetical protein [Bacillota bacterium]